MELVDLQKQTNRARPDKVDSNELERILHKIERAIGQIDQRAYRVAQENKELLTQHDTLTKYIGTCMSDLQTALAVDLSKYD